MKKTSEENINTGKYWDEVYISERHSGKQRIDDDRRQFLYGAMRDIQQYYPDMGGLKILDAGCGNGEMLVLAHAVFPAWRKCGIDICSKTLEYANEQNPEFVLNDDSIYHINALDNYFDLTHCGETLEHLDQPEKAITELVRVTRHKGNLVLSIPFLNKNPSNEHLWEWGFDEALSMTRKYGTITNIQVCDKVSLAWVTKIDKGKTL